MKKIELTKCQIEAVCDAIASGGSIAEACLEISISEPTFYRCLARDLEFAEAVKSARIAQQDREIEYCIALADKATPESWQVAKLQIWARQWRASKLAPKKYGEKLTLAGDDDQPLRVETIQRRVIDGAADITQS